MLISLPMYGVDPQDVLPFWQLLSQQLRRYGAIGIDDVIGIGGVAGISDQLVWPTDLLQHWRDPDLLLSQTCGFPLMMLLQQQVQLIGVFSYQSPYCSGEYYRSLVVVRADEKGQQLADFRHRVVAYNSTDSQSGYNALRALIAPLAINGRFFFPQFGLWRALPFDLDDPTATGRYCRNRLCQFCAITTSQSLSRCRFKNNSANRRGSWPAPYHVIINVGTTTYPDPPGYYSYR
ncbi:ABC-type phosphate/phosphonate transport system%2Cperiplasmic component [Yersinia intermedia]|nr:ABC-type phosphate/phosphonate transport system%2Cperiplasmic component [Yersinia intermedia]CQD75462.1 ABC-type phosphate/phosphonate transport system%2Cperiplasmic component [Yersinia intermedia]